MIIKDSIISRDGIKLGDFVLVNKANGYYGRVVKIYKKIYEADDYIVEYYYRFNGKAAVAGDEGLSTLSVLKIMNLDLTTPKKKVLSAIESQVVRVDKDFIMKIFKKVNDALAYTKMLNEQEGLI